MKPSPISTKGIPLPVFASFNSLTFPSCEKSADTELE